ncbi:vacuolar serine-type carboxypeptidase Atg42p [Diutina catenulata]
MKLAGLLLLSSLINGLYAPTEWSADSTDAAYGVDIGVLSTSDDEYRLQVVHHDENKNKPHLKLDTQPYYTGYLDVKATKSHFFYWFFESRNDPKNDPIILWLNGGPGCSSSTGLFFELGPCSINKDLSPEINPYSWTNNASIIFLDQPVGVGYSYSDDPDYRVNSTYAAAADVYSFLDLFFTKFPQYQSNKFHMATESYGGHYMPAFAAETLKYPDRIFNVSSVLIGNGITDAKSQFPYYHQMLCGMGGYPAVISDEACARVEERLPQCLALVDYCYQELTDEACEQASIFCGLAMDVKFKDTGLNNYDLRRQCEGDGCYKEQEEIIEFLSRNSTKHAVGAKIPDSFVGCSGKVGRDFYQTSDRLKPFQGDVAKLLDNDIPVLIFAGDKDSQCNWLGNEAWTKKVQWKGKKGFDGATPRMWTVDGEDAGLATNYNHFTFLRVFDAGHMVPHDQPQRALDMFLQWVHHGNYGFK